MLTIEVGDIVHLKFDALSSNYGKNLVNLKHPVVIIDITDNKIACCPVSSVMEKVSDRFPYNVPLIHWKESSFTKPTHVKCDAKIVTTTDKVHKKLSKLSEVDEYNVITYYNNASYHRFVEDLDDTFDWKFLRNNICG